MLAWLLGVLVAALGSLAVGGPLGLLVVVPAVLVLLEPSPIAERLIPRGPAWLVWWATRLSLVVWRRDRRGGADLMATRAAMAAGHVPAAPRVLGPITTGTVLSAGITAAARGDEVDGRALVATSGWFDAQPEPLSVVRQEWIAAEHAQRGAWDRIALEVPPTASSPRLRLLKATAERLLDLDDAPDAAVYEQLSRPFANHPEWRPLIDRARGARHRAAFVAPPLPEDPLARALEVHRRALLDPAWLDAAVEAWDDAPPPAAARERILEDLAAACVASRTFPDTAGGSVSAALVDHLQSALLTDLEAQTRALTSRRLAKHDLEPLAEAQELAWFVERFPLTEGSVAGAAALHRRQAFRICYAPLVDWSADLYNRRNQPYLFRATTRWLLAQAKLAGDTQAEAVLTQNLAVSAQYA
jgi:hypothetical protein